jgi:hypothetical protein
MGALSLLVISDMGGKEWLSTNGINCKIAYPFSFPQPRCHLPNSPWEEIINLFPAGESFGK